MSLRRVLGFAVLALFSKNVLAQSNVTGPQTIVYKTKKDYSNNVPVILSEDKSHIVTYPHPSDLKSEYGYMTPTKLRKGYWLDNRGINKNVAFLDISYKDYAALPDLPTETQLWAMIKDKDPIVSMCECGFRSEFKNPKKDLNKLISKKKLKTKCRFVK